MYVDLKELVYEAKWHNRTKRRKSAWRNGLKQYIEEIVNNRYGDDRYVDIDEETSFLNGARDWGQYSYGGCSLIYDYDIALRLCNPSEFAKKKEGMLPPNSNETWLDVQARALAQAALSIRWALRKLK